MEFLVLIFLSRLSISREFSLILFYVGRAQRGLDADADTDQFFPPLLAPPKKEGLLTARPGNLRPKKCFPTYSAIWRKKKPLKCMSVYEKERK